EQALQTQLANIQKRTGKTIAQLHQLLKKAKLEKHGEMVTLLKTELGMGHGDANTVAHSFRNPALLAGGSLAAAAPGAAGDPLDDIYADKKAALRPLHDAVMKAIDKFGAFEIAPKKGYVSLRRAKQFAMVGPGTKGRLEIGVNLKDRDGDERFVAQKAGGMCQFKVWLTEPKEVDKELVAFLRAAFDAAG
ncbi:MAG: DUF4287 domain-containing protein, partial [Planctomycetes bacterium]|nr:DUF4287 domain-containing protein [Planctomycetota bacterium]